VGRGAAAGNKGMKKRPVAFPFLGVLQVRIGGCAAKHVLFPGIFVVANKELEAEFGDALQWVTDLAEVKGYRWMVANALDDEVPSSISQLVEES